MIDGIVTIRPGPELPWVIGLAKWLASRGAGIDGLTSAVNPLEGLKADHLLHKSVLQRVR